jgi:hypothetical protein
MGDDLDFRWLTWQVCINLLIGQDDQAHLPGLIQSEPAGSCTFRPDCSLKQHLHHLAIIVILHLQEISAAVQSRR